jgi:ribosomal protein L30/L7E
MTQHDYPTEVISLPSEGKCYPSENPLSSGQIEIKYMTAREEEILASQNLIKKGIVLDKLFETIIVDTNINSDDIILGDKNAIMLATRILGYGPEYIVEVEDSDGIKSKVSVDLGKVQTKDIDLEILNGNNEYEFTTPVGKNKIVFKLLTHGDEKLIDADIKALNKINRESSSELTTRYRHMIKSVDGKDDTKSIVDFINNKFLARDTKAFREHLKKIQPDVKMEFEYTDNASGEKEVRPIPMGVGFFWPSE